jgi:hypothetical protein
MIIIIINIIIFIIIIITSTQSTSSLLTFTHEFQCGDGLQYHCIVESQLGKVQSHFIA